MPSLCGHCDKPGQRATQVCSLHETDEVSYCVGCLIIASAHLPVERVRRSELSPDFDEIAWDGVTAKECHMRQQGPHWERICKANLNSPLLLVKLNDATIVLDGRHRLVKAHLENIIWLTGKYLDAEALRQCVFDTSAAKEEEATPPSQHHIYIGDMGVPFIEQSSVSPTDYTETCSVACYIVGIVIFVLLFMATFLR